MNLLLDTHIFLWLISGDARLPVSTRDAIQNPENLQSQVEGAIIMGLGGALTEEVEFEEGRILTTSLKDYRVPRYKDIPPMDIVLVNRPDLPSAGAGETPIVTIAPAIANAIYHATGKRLRKLPLELQA